MGGGQSRIRRARGSRGAMRTRLQARQEPAGPEDLAQEPGSPDQVGSDEHQLQEFTSEGVALYEGSSDGEYELASEELEGELETDEDEDVSDDEEEEDDRRRSPVHRLMQMIGVSSARQAQMFPRISRDYIPAPLEGDLAAELSACSSASHPRHPVNVVLPCKRRLLQSLVTNPAHQLLIREGSFDGRGGMLSAAQRAHFLGMHRLPAHPTHLGDRMNSRGYIGQFTTDGDLFVAAYQNERRIKVYDVQCGWRVLKNVHARNLRWTVTDTALSADQKFLLYASISATVHLVNVSRGAGEGEESIANVTDIHEPLEFAGGGEGSSYSTGIWSLRWAADSTEVVAGTADNSVYVYDVTAGKTTIRVQGHQDDVNAVAYADPAAPCQLIFSGSDDCMVKVWDRRTMSGRRSQPAGVLMGHTEGIAHIDSKGDGRYLLSNSKDQTAKLWDLRMMRSQSEVARLRRDPAPHFSWDYRWMEYPGRGRLVSHPHDASLMTFRGHSVLNTLIRAYWSPAATTGQRFVYSGSADGGVWIYDVLTGRVVSVLRYHTEVVRDCSWHPHLPLLASVSFDGSICCWEPEAPGDAEMDAEEAEAKQHAQRSGDSSSRPGGGIKASRLGRGLPMPARDQLGDEW